MSKMASQNIAPNVDMNDAWNLDAYSQILVYQKDSFANYLHFSNVTRTQQKVLQSLAHGVGLEYEYSLYSRQAIISRPFWDPELVFADNIWQLDTTQDSFEPLESSFDDFMKQAANDAQLGPPTSLGMRQFSELQQMDPMTRFDDDPSMQGQYQVNHGERISFVSNVVPPLVQSMNSSGNPRSLRRVQAFFHKSPVVLQEDTSTRPSISNMSKSPRPGHSRTTSTGSIQSTHSRARVQKVSSKNSSNNDVSSSMYSCFDSKSDKSIATDVSSASRRSRRSLDSVAKATMKAVKAVGACWRCKFLRKSCSDQTPCGSCPRDTHTSEWQILGCQRGKIKEKMISVAVCRSAISHGGTPSYDMPSYRREETLAEEANIYHKTNLVIREKEVVAEEGTSANEKIENPEAFLHAVDSILPTVNWRPAYFASTMAKEFAAKLHPLEECIRCILWEILYSPIGELILNKKSVNNLTFLLRSAALYQSRTEGDHLIAQSLICLRSCLEVMRLDLAGGLKDFSHGWCLGLRCKVTSIANLDADILRYLDELSRVFHSKENMRNFRGWWLSGFYSLCIQSFVRRALISLFSKEVPGISEQQCFGAQEYLHLSLRLFIAYSRTYDPLTRDIPSNFGPETSSEDKLFMNEIRIAQIIVGDWATMDIKSTSDYLKMILNDNGKSLHQPDKERVPASNVVYLSNLADDSTPTLADLDFSGLSPGERRAMRMRTTSPMALKREKAFKAWEAMEKRKQ